MLLILFLPSSGMNDDYSYQLMDIIVNIKGKGFTSIIISNKLNENIKVADADTIIRYCKSIETKLQHQ
ncbi:hypothetical protein ACCC99_21390 [Paenarthrobacter nicotinovorans]